MCEVPLYHATKRRVLQLTSVIFFFFTLATGPTRSVSLKLSDARVYEPQIQARPGTTAQFCRVVVLKFTRVAWRGLAASLLLLLLYYSPA